MAVKLDSRCAEWRDLHKTFGGDLSWEEISERVGDLSGNAIRKQVYKWLRSNEAPATAGVSSVSPSVEFPHLKVKSAPGWGMDFLETVATVQDTMQALDTTQTKSYATIHTDLPTGIILPGDFHVGGRGTDHRRLREDIRMWQSLGDAVKLALMGDYSEQFAGGLARVGLHQHVLTTDMQIETVVDLFVNELGPQTIAYLKGNHDGWAGAELSNYVMRMAQRVGVPFMGLGGELFLTVGAVQYKLALWHRYPGASALNRGNNQRRVRIDHNGADVVALAHLHNAYVEFSQTGEINCVSLRCGAYKTTDEHSRDAAGNVQADLRMPMVILSPLTNDKLYYEDFRKGVSELLRLRREWRDHPSFAVSAERLQRMVGV